jgi:L-threonylcarbamoyladenylate synthase
MVVVDDSDEGLRRAAEVIKQGGIAAFPTETVYGLGADAFNAAALARVFAAKGRPRFDPLIVHIAPKNKNELIPALSTVADLGALNEERRSLAETLAAAFWPGPLTLVLPKQAAVPDLATAGLPTVAVRFPAHPAARKLIEFCATEKRPGAVAAPSANPFGALSPTSASHVAETLGDKIDLLVAGGASEVGVESTVLDLSSEAVRILRPGGISRERLAEFAEVQPYAPFAAAGKGAASPGMLKSHYAPSSPLILHHHSEMEALPIKEDEAYLLFSGARPFPNALTLSAKGDAAEAAANLFGHLHQLEKRGPVRIHAELLPAGGLGEAVNDRLTRAAAK